MERNRDWASSLLSICQREPVVFVVGRGGYEIYPHHQRFLEQWQSASVPQDAHPEPSAAQGRVPVHAATTFLPSTCEGIVCERFCCGPPSICEAAGSAKRFGNSDMLTNPVGTAATSPRASILQKMLRNTCLCAGVICSRRAHRFLCLIVDTF